jgi:Ca2+-binding EF-hand superfamily protein
MSSVSSATSSNAAYYAAQQKLFSKLDSDENGTLSKDEFVAGRPKDVSAEQSAALYSKIDSSGSGALTEDQLSEGMDSNRSSSPESQVSAEVMAVLMQLQQSGMMSSGGGMSDQGGQSASDLYAKIDADSDGSVTQAEFVSARPEEMSEDDAKAIYASIDTENTGSITEAQFTESLQASGPGGPPPSGGAPSSEEVYDSLDTNQDGSVSETEFLAGKPEDMSETDAQALYDSIDTEGTGSITEQQLADSMSAGPGGPPPSGGAPSSEEVYDSLDTNQDGTVSQAEFLAAKPDDVSTEDATALFTSIDSEGTGSISEEQFSAFMDASRPERPASTTTATSDTDISSLLALLDTGATEDAASVLA